MSSASSLRLFIALSLPEALRAAVAEATASFAGAASGVRWAAPPSLHLTLLFLGERPADQPERIVAALQPVCAHSARFDLVLGRTGCFPDARRPRVLWLGIAQGAEPVAALQGAVSAALTRARLAQPDDRFSPHLTLGRIADAVTPTARQALGSSWLALRLPDFSAIPVTGVHLMRSELRRDGAQYTTVHTLPLR